MSDLDPFDYGQHDDSPPPSQERIIAEQTEDSDFKWLMTDQRGRRIMRRLLERTGVFRVSFTGDAQTTAFREGERNVGLEMIAQVQRHAPDRLASILTGKDINERLG